MNWYFYLNYYIYCFYVRFKDQIPVFSAWIVVTLLLHFNIFTIVASYTLITDFWTVPELTNRSGIIAKMAFLGLINYLLLYRKKKYIKVFDKFKKNEDYYKKWNKSSLLYIVLSIVFALIAVYISVWRNHKLGIYS